MDDERRYVSPSGILAQKQNSAAPSRFQLSFPFLRTDFASKLTFLFLALLVRYPSQAIKSFHTRNDDDDDDDDDDDAVQSKHSLVLSKHRRWMMQMSLSPFFVAIQRVKQPQLPTGTRFDSRQWRGPFSKE